MDDYGLQTVQRDTESETPDARNGVIGRYGKTWGTRPGIGKSNTTGLGSAVYTLMNLKSGYCKDNYFIARLGNGNLIANDILRKTWTSQADWDSGTKSQVDTTTTAGDIVLASDLASYYTLANLPQSANVQGYWKFEEASGLLYDETANDNDGAYNGALYQQSGKAGYALGFDGSDDYIGLGTDASLKPTGAISIAFWIYCDDVTTTRAIFANGNHYWPGAGSSYGIFAAIYATGPAYAVIVGDGTTQFQTTTSAPVAGVWQHVVITLSNTEHRVRVYINGTQASSEHPAWDVGTYSYEGTPVETRIGRTLQSQAPFDGLLDEFTVWDVVLTAAEIAALYNAQYYSNGYDRLQYDSTSVDTDWGYYVLSGDRSTAGTNIKIRFRTASTQAGLASAAWGAYKQSLEGYITTGKNEWLEAEVYLETTDTSLTPTVYSLTVWGNAFL